MARRKSQLAPDCADANGLDRARDQEGVIDDWRGAERRDKSDIEDVLAAPEQRHDDERQSQFGYHPPDSEPGLSHVHERIRFAEPELQNLVGGRKIGAAEHEHEKYEQCLH